MTETQKENEEKKRCLLRYSNAKALAKELDEELYILRMGKLFPSSHISGEPGGTEGNDLSSYVAAVDDLKRKILNTRYQQIKTYTAISDAINELENEDGSINPLPFIRWLQSNKNISGEERTDK